MKERPILFSGEMIRAILDGRKTQTRRIVKIPAWFRAEYDDLNLKESTYEEMLELCVDCPFGKPGDWLWVRETFQALWKGDGPRPNDETGELYEIFYRATDKAQEYFDESKEHCAHEGVTSAWAPSIHMPRWASRITLEITNIRVERLQDISEEDAWKEGFPDPDGKNREYPDRARYWFRCLWNNLAGQHKPDWYGNPWVWVIEFKQL